MITIGDKQFRNLEEQVKKNMDDIQYILEEEGVLNEFGIKIVGQITTAGDLPDPTTYEGEYGDAYAVGTDAPYTIYIYTRANGTHPNDYWFNIGQFPLAGKDGPQGPTGPAGPQGTRGSLWYIGNGMPTTKDANANDKYLNATNGNVYTYTGSQWYLYGNIRGPQGIQGQQGNVGPQGQQGIQGPKGEKGDPGPAFVIAGTVATTGQLPDPSTISDNIAYLVGSDNDYDLYVQLQDTQTWQNVGKVEGVQGPPGPQGVQGPKGEQGIQGIQGPAGTNGANGRGITSVTNGSPVTTEQYTQTPITVTYSDSTNSQFVVYAEKGQKGEPGTQGPKGDTGEQGPKGEPGPMPTLASERGSSASIAISQLGIENIFYNTSTQLGIQSNALGTNSVAIGPNANANGDYSIAIGNGASSSTYQSIAIGLRAITGYDDALALGRDCNANGSSSIAIGQSNANSEYSIAIGTRANADARYSTAIGYFANALSDNSIQLGKGNNVTENTFQVWNYTLLDNTTGKIPQERLPSSVPATIPVANSTTLGGVMPVNKTDDMTQEVGVDSTGKLYTAPGSGGGGGDYLPLTGGTMNQGARISFKGNYGSSVSGGDGTPISIITTKRKPTDGDMCINIQTESVSYSTRINPGRIILDGDATYAATIYRQDGIDVAGGWMIDFPEKAGTFALLSDIPTFTDNGDGTMTITANGSTYKVAIVTE